MRKIFMRYTKLRKIQLIYCPNHSLFRPIKRPKHDFLFGGQRIRAETTNVRNRTFAQDIFGVLNEVDFYNHGMFLKSITLM